MKVLKILLLSSLILFLLPKELAAKDGFIVHLSSKDPHRVSMAFSFASKMAVDSEVFVFVDIDGVYPMLKESENIEYKNFEAVRTMIDELLQKGVKIGVCSMCLEAAGYTQYNLIDGLKIAEKKDFTGLMSDRIITIDY